MFTDNGLDLPCRSTWGQGDYGIREDSPREVFRVLKVPFTIFDRDVIASTSPGIFKGSQVLERFMKQKKISSRTSYLKHCGSSRRCVFEMVPFVNIVLPMHV